MFELVPNELEFQMRELKLITSAAIAIMKQLALKWSQK